MIGTELLNSFAVLAGSTITNTGPSVITGSMGVYPGSAITGFPPGIVSDVVNHTDVIVAKSNLTGAYTDMVGRKPSVTLTGKNLGGVTLDPGTYRYDSSAQLTGTLTLDAHGDQDAVFVFDIESTLTTASDSKVTLINGANGSNVFWRVGSSATLGTGTLFSGKILANDSITLTTGAKINGGAAWARNGAVTLDSNAISV